MNGAFIFSHYITMQPQDFHIVVWQEGDQFVAKVLENNVSSFGATLDEAYTHVKEAIDLYYEDEATPTSYIKPVTI